MADPILPIITDAGIAAAFAADALGEHVSIATVGLGDTGWTPDSTATALQTEQVVANIASGSNPAPNQVHLAALFDGPEEFWIREVGFYLEDSTLFAVWSDPTEVIGYKSALADFLLTLDIVLSVIPPGSVTLETSDFGLGVGLAADIAAVVARVDVIEPVYLIAEDMPISPNYLYSSKRFEPFCGGALNTPLSWDSGGITAPYSGYFPGGSPATGDLIIEVVDANDTTRLTTLGIEDLGVLGAYGVGGKQYYIAVLDMQCTETFAAGPIFYLKLYDREGAVASDEFVSNETTAGEVRTQLGFFAFPMIVDTGFVFAMQDHSLSGINVILTPAEIGSWQYYRGARVGRGYDGRFAFASDGIYGSGGQVKVAIALPYYGHGDHKGLQIWTESIQDIVDGLA